jgi:hypothetical protein
MTAAPRRAYAQARTRARRASILEPATIQALVAVPAIGAVRGWQDLRPSDDGLATLAAVYARLVGDYEVVIAAYPEARGALVALLRLHEIENVKLLWRAAARQAAPSEWRHCWRPLGRLAAVAADALRPGATPGELAAALAPTPYGAIAGEALRAHAADLAAAELAFDRFASQAVAAAATGLPARERSARALLYAVLAERDAALVERATATLGISAERARSLTALGALPRQVVDRRRLCRRCFATEPYALALPIALVLLREDECRQLVTLAERRARRGYG